MKRGLLLLALLCGTAWPLSAQSPRQLLQSGIDAYQRLEIGNAAGFLRRALSTAPPEGLSGADHAQALSYLAAAELLRDRGDSARSAFRQLVLRHPRHRPDALTFPPPVLNLFEAVRQETKVVALAAPDTALFRRGDEFYLVRAYASSPHDVTATLEEPGGAVIRELYRGPIGDSLVLRWNGLTDAREVIGSGEYLLRVASLSAAGRELRLAQVPLSVQVLRRDTLPLPPAAPPDSVLLPEAVGAGPAISAFGTGAAVGLGALLLPSLFGADDPAGSRVVVTGVVTFGAILGFIARRPGTPLDDNVAVNRAAVDAWQREHDSIARENRLRLDDVRVQVTSGSPQRIDRESR